MILFRYAVTILHPTPLILVRIGNLFVNPGINLGILRSRNKTPFFREVRERGGPSSFLGSNER
jgi:hypothetical protein